MSVNLNFKLKDSSKPLNFKLGEKYVIEKGGTSDYEKINNKPKINGEELSGNKTFEQLGEETLTTDNIRDSVDKAFKAIFGG